MRTGAWPSGLPAGLTIAKVAPLKKISVGSTDAAAALCRVYTPLRSTNDPSIPEVVLKIIVVREEQVAHHSRLRKCENVFVVGTTDALGLKCLSFCIHLIITNLSGETELLSIPKPSYKVAILG